MLFKIVCIIAIVGVALLIGQAIGGLNKGLVILFQKAGFGKTGSYIFGCCIFLVLLAILKSIFSVIF